MKANHFLVLGTTISYILLFTSFSRMFIIIPFGIFFCSALYYWRNIEKALFSFLIFTLPYSVGKTLIFINDNTALVLTPFTIGVMVLSLLSLKKEITSKLILSDILVIFFLFWGIISFVAINTTGAVIIGIFKLAIATFFYFLAKIYLKVQKLQEVIVFIFLTIIFFESIITISQFLLGRPLGISLEEGLNVFPFGKLASEDQLLYRPAGTMSTPTWISRFITMLLPFLFLCTTRFFYPIKVLTISFYILALFAIFVTSTRVSWVSSFLLILFIFIWKKPNIRLPDSMIFKVLSILLIFVFSLFAFPRIIYRVNISNLSFEEGGSFDYRIKLFHEAVNLIQQYPIFGVGLNNFVPKVLEENITGFFKFSADQVHNLWLLITSEMGIPAGLIFIFFVVSSYLFYLRNRQKIKKTNLLNFKDAAALGGLIYLFETLFNITFLAPHYYLFYLFMAILVI